MKIKISGYKNIENLEMYIDDYKINMLFGMSGSGKSSIAEALQKKDLEENCTCLNLLLCKSNWRLI